MTDVASAVNMEGMDEAQKKEKIETLRKKIDRLKCAQYISGLELSPISFFYWYRIKANYRDLEFIDGGPGSVQLANYYLSYHKLTSDFYLAFKNLINKVVSDRLGNMDLLIP